MTEKLANGVTEVTMTVPPTTTTEEEKGEVTPGLKTRETWQRRFDFLLACVGFSVGLGNVWRFPYLCYKNGGGAFLIPYYLCAIFGGIPIFYLEVSIGQFMNRGGLQAWNIVPLFQGIGLSSCIIVFFLNCYYNVIMTWAFYYFFSSFTSQLPWERCNNSWNDPQFCAEDFRAKAEELNASGLANLSSSIIDPATEFWENKVLSISEGIDEMGTVKWDLALCLLFAWIVVYACICKGIRSSGKVMYVTATSPYVFMVILLTRNSLLPGARQGVEFYLTPNISKLAEMQVWVDAGTQIFFSNSIALGTLTALGSYNKFNHNSFRDSVLFACVDAGTSFLAGFIVFTILGYMAQLQGKDIRDVAESGPGLAFIAYPKAVSQMPVSPLWSVLFFFMIILLGLDSQFVGVEGVVTTVVDQFPKLLRKGRRKEIFIAIICSLMFFVGLPMVSNGGMYVFQLFDYYSGSRIILLVAFFEVFAITYVYGVRRFLDNCRMMLGDTCMTRLLYYVMLCWTVLSPTFCLSIFVMSTINYSELDYKRPGSRGTYVYPGWAVGIGWAMAGFAAIWIPLVALYKWIKNGATWEAFGLLCKPYGLDSHQLRPQDVGEKTLADLERKRKGGVPPGTQSQIVEGELNRGYRTELETPDDEPRSGSVNGTRGESYTISTKL